MAAKVLMLICATLFFIIGASHLILTFFTRKLDPLDRHSGHE